MKQYHCSPGKKTVPVALCLMLTMGCAASGVCTAWADTGFEWTWMKGASFSNQSGTYGTLGTLAAANVPGARDGAVSWTDGTGALWLFGGDGYDSVGTHAYLNDLWKCDPSTGNWAWMKGSVTGNQPGTYGSLGTPDEVSTPGGRCSAVSWTDSTGALWLFGGLGYDSVGNYGVLTDLWKYYPATGNWAWMKGSNLGVNQSGTYGTLGTPDAANTPGGRTGAASWTDREGALWLFGGDGVDGAGDHGNHNDLWKYDPTTGNWTWMKGSSLLERPGVYGTLGTFDAANTPGARHGSVSWTDNIGALWLFGGYGVGSTWNNYGYLNDLWKFDPTTGNWTWIKGKKAAGASYAVYGTQGTPDEANTPGARTPAASWIDKSGALWIFGGYGYSIVGPSKLNDLWKYDPATGNWAWMSGSKMNSQTGIYGALGTPGVVNTPGARQSAAAWTDGAGALWLFGGFDNLDSFGNDHVLNDLWRYVVVPMGTIVINSGRSATNNTNATLSLTWNANGGPEVTRMRFSDDGSHWTPWQTLSAAVTHQLQTGDGHKTVRLQFLNKANTKSPVCSDYVLLDTTPPIGGITINDGATTTTSQSVTMGLTYSDGTGGSGVSRMRFSDDGAHWTAWMPPQATCPHTLPTGLGYHTVRVQYLDNTGNYSAVFNDYIKTVAL